MKRVALVMRFCVLALCAAALAACASQIEDSTYTDAFDAPGAWGLSADAAARISIAEGQFRVEIHEPSQIAWGAAGRELGEFFRLEVEATPLEGPVDNEYGVLLRMAGDARFYAFSISGDGYARAALYDQGAWTVLGSDWTPSDAIRQGMGTNTLAVECRDGAYAFLVNGTKVLEIEDTTLTKGDLGLYAGTFGEGGLVVAFDDLVLAPLEE
jgi:hypothetical protein